MGIVILATHYLGTRQVSLRQKRAVKTPADLAGVKMRMPAGPEWLLLGRTLGVTPVPLGMPEVYLAMKTGTVDGQENPLSILNAAKFYEVSEQIVLTAHMVQPVFFAIAKPVWDKLNPDHIDAIGRGAERREIDGVYRQAAVLERLHDGLFVGEPGVAAGLGGFKRRRSRRPSARCRARSTTSTFSGASTPRCSICRSISSIRASAYFLSP